MSIYTLSLNYIDGIAENKSQLLNVFYKFPNPDNEHKAAMDKSKRLLDHYLVFTQTNNDFLTWLDWMSRKPESFEIIDVTIPDNVDEEEMYLMIASATQPYKKVIVGSHQYWKNHNYITNCNRIKYNSNEVTILDKEEAFTELNSQEKITQNITIQNHMAKKNNPWISGSFYLLSGIVLVSVLCAVANFISPIALPIIVIGSLIFFSIIGAYQLRNDEMLTEKSFLSLMMLSFKQIPFLNSSKKK